MAVDNYNQRRSAISRWNEFTKSEHLSLIREPRKIKFDEKTLFISAITNGDIDEVTKIIDNSESKLSVINQVNSDGLTPLHLACIDENYYIVKILIKYGANVNISDVDGWTPLHAASGAHSIDVVRELLNAGASLTFLNNDGHLPIDIAEDDEIKSYLKYEYDKQKINIEEVKKEEEQNMLKDVNLWIETGIIQDGPHSQGETSLHIAAAKGYMSVLKLLLKAGLNIDDRDTDGWTPLHAASHWNKMDVVKFLLDEGASTTLVTNKGLSFMDVAHENIKDDLENYVRSFSIKQAFIRGKNLSKQSSVHSQQTENKNINDSSTSSNNIETVIQSTKVDIQVTQTKVDAESKINLDIKINSNGIQSDKSNEPKKPLINSIKMDIPLPKSTLVSPTSTSNTQIETKLSDSSSDNNKKPLKIDKSVVLSNIPIPKPKNKTDVSKDIVTPVSSVQNKDSVKSPSNIKSAVNMDILLPKKPSTNSLNSPKTINNEIPNQDPIRPGINSNISISDKVKSKLDSDSSDLSSSKDIKNIDSKQMNNNNSKSTTSPMISHEVSKVKSVSRSNSLRSNEMKQSNSILSKAATFGAVLPNSYRRSIDENVASTNNSTSSNQKEVEQLKESLDLALAKEKMLVESLNKLTKEKDELLFKIDQLELEKTKRDSSSEENKKLKDENAALIRVIARLSRENLSVDKTNSSSTNS